MTKLITKAEVARIARKLWHYEGERREGRGTVRAVLEAAGFTIVPTKRSRKSRYTVDMAREDASHILTDG